ncbi:short-chain dehydrogenase [Afipia sp. P52-10]|jgi:NAD(P)-dependent dehydrogenase (short-subunit alcohol dehydrogenase family)|uniref:SDR family NAD(P)-dependent oxidoreductase n=1 Tax=Afipia sp. P52-10 TaxID=1429916 RepID=UPI0003DF073B|nr:SDR family NAD(P)-dependent oxidoreductase [Afipia sp. P52-10]ETR76316.1 short-chain dehydrogenase [Afipia sp. P52-10]
MTESLFSTGHVAVITGAASGIGLAAATKYAGLGMNVVLADLPGPKLNTAAAAVAAVSNPASVLAVPVDVSVAADLERLQAQAFDRFGAVHVLMNNAGIGLNPGSAFKAPDEWRRLLDINLLGVVNGVQAFLPAMIASKTPGLVINTGSKQGITTPPGNLAYNVSKAAVKAYTEGLAHELRNTPGCAITAHLLIPGYTFTGMTARSAEKPAAAWTGEQVIDFMIASIGRGDFYILCPDNDVSRPMDERRILWAAGDIIENRPALSRWHKDYTAAFEAFMEDARKR